MACANFPIFRVQGGDFASGLKGLLVASDMQGRDAGWSSSVVGHRLLGEKVAEDLQILGELGEIPAPETVGVLLAGDLYVAEDFWVSAVVKAMFAMCGEPSEMDFAGLRASPETMIALAGARTR